MMYKDGSIIVLQESESKDDRLISLHPSKEIRKKYFGKHIESKISVY